MLPPSMQHASRYHFRWSPVWTVFLAALVLRVFYTFESRDYPGWLHPVIDAASMHQFAAQWANEGIRNSTMAWHTPLYPMFLALIYKFLGASILAAKLVQALIGALHAAVLAWMAGRLFNRRAAWITGLAATFYGPFIFYDGELVSASLAVTWTLAFMVWTLIYPQRRFRAWALCGGLILAAGTLTRVELLPAMALGMTAAIVTSNSGKRWTNAGILAAIFLLALIPTAVMNRPFHGRTVLLPGNSALNLYLGNSGDLCRTLTARPGPDYDAIVREPICAGREDPAAQSAYFREKTGHLILHDPVTFFRDTLWKTLIHLNGREITADIDLYTAREWSALIRALVWRIGPAGFPFLPVLMLAAAGFIYRPRCLPRPWLLFIVGLSAALILTHPACRYRMPMLPVLLMLLGPGWEALRARRTAPILAACGTGLIALFPLHTCLEDIPFKAELLRLAGRYPQEPAVMRAMLDEAQSLNPDDPQVYYELGRLDLEEKDETAARQNFTHALRLQPRYPEVLVHLSWLNREVPEVAIRLLQEALRYNPQDAEAHAELAGYFVRQGELIQAGAQIAAAIRYRPQDPLLHLNYAALLLEAGEAQAARRHLESIAAAWPADPRFPWNTGIACLRTGDVPAARRYFHETLKLDPEFTEAEEVLKRLEQTHTEDTPHP